MPDALLAHFSTVQRLQPSEVLRQAHARESAPDLLVVARLEACAEDGLPWLEGLLSASARDRSASCRVLVTCANRHWWRRPKDEVRAKGFTRAQLRGTLRRAGWRPSEEFYLQPYPYPPARNVIPAWSGAAAAAERIEHVSTRLGSLRPVVATMGLHALLYPGLACVGRV